MKKPKQLKAVLVTAAVAAGIAAAGAAPARAADTCRLGSGTYLCQYGVATTTFPEGTKEQFVIGTDSAVWTRWTNTSGTWSGFLSMGGVATSGVTISQSSVDGWNIAITVRSTDGYLWDRVRDHNGNWTAWDHIPDPS
ncbi:hypothetical protein ACFYNO_40025 [Kitasatospora sp. NPDC006697]|uniref:hypothetical protein n=1 Tax=Kitasatospora sp. NPDC006697 TaxID=3364020 RepID=UPI0036A06C48